MKYLSLFSGMECAHQAWEPLGWQCVGVSEIEPNACALLAHRLPGAPNLGSVTAITDAQIAALGHIDVVIGGSPCQDLSVAGKRAGLGGARSSLFHEQLRIFHAARKHCGARWLVWENVPGAFSSHAGRDFAVVVGSMAGADLVAPADGWGSEGMAVGENGLVEWCVLDAQWFGVAQRRRRVFAVLDAGDWASRPPVLLERDGLRGDFAPSRETGEDVTGGAARSVAIRGQDGTSQAELGDEVANTLLTPSGGRAGIGIGAVLTGIPDIAPTIRAGACNGGAGHGARSGDSKDELIIPVWPAEVACTLNASFGSKQGLEDQHALGGGNSSSLPPAAACLTTGTGQRYDPETETLIPTIGGVFDVAHTLRGDGFDASEDGTGRGTPLVPVVAFDTTQITSAENGSNPKPGDPCHPLAAYAHAPAIAFGWQNSEHQGNSCSEHVTPTLDKSKTPAVAVRTAQTSSNGWGVNTDTAYTLDQTQGQAVATGMAVRRLTPTECERLQGVEDGWTLVPNKHGKPMADGPRYKMIGNSFARPCITWIGRQIERAESYASQEAA